MNRIQSLKYYYKQATKPVALVALTIGFVGVLLGAAGLFMVVRYGQLHQQLVVEQQQNQHQQTELHSEAEPAGILVQQDVYPLTYQVKAGDSLWKISEQFYGHGCYFKELVVANNITDPNHLAIGMEVLIPAPPQEKRVIGSNQAEVNLVADNVVKESNNIVKINSTTDSASTTDRENFVYQVEPGDSLWFIALKYYGDGNRWTEIYAYNQLTVGDNPNLIFPGTKLTL